MGRKAKLKKIRQKSDSQSNSAKYDKTQFVEQFTKMGYQAKIAPQHQPKTNRGNIAPEIPQARIEPQL